MTTLCHGLVMNLMAFYSFNLSSFFHQQGGQGQAKGHGKFEVQVSQFMSSVSFSTRFIMFSDFFERVTGPKFEPA